MGAIKYILLVIILSFSLKSWAHPMPHSLLLLDIKDNGISATLSLPLKEFQLVFPNEDLDMNYLTLVQRKDKWLDDYLLQHFSIADSSGRPWIISILEKNVSENEQMLTGKYHELTFKLLLQTPQGATPRHFTMHYDVIMHQLVTHKLFIRINSDWDRGLLSKESEETDLGVLSVSPGDGTIPAVVVNLDEGSTWKGFKAMIKLGMDHIAEGTDHLLFLLVLMLAAPLLAENGKWTTSGGVRYSVIRLLKIATAFTIGHSVTLLAGAIGWLHLPSQPVEIMIAISILISALHVIKPLFYGREALIAMAFGLVHGLAFASTLSELNLESGRMALSILGFNVGIELMQFFVITLVVPWLIILSTSKQYKVLRISFSVFAIIASLGWIAERASGTNSGIVTCIEYLFSKGRYSVLALAILSGIYSFSKRIVEKKSL